MRLHVVSAIWVPAVFGLLAGAAQAQVEHDYELTAPGAIGNDRVGWSLAATEEWAFVGAFGWDLGLNPGQGAVFVYHRTSEGWPLHQILRASDGAQSDFFGWAVAAEGSTVVVGAYMADAGMINSGAAYVYRWDGESWVQDAKLVAKDRNLGDAFGFSVAIDKGRILVGAIGADGNSGAPPGSAYLFEQGPMGWHQTSKYRPVHPTLKRVHTGLSVDIDGDVVVLGSRTLPSSLGAVFVYERVGGKWLQTQILEDPTPTPEDEFKICAVEGNLIVVGEIKGNFAFSGARPGSAFFFERSGLGPGGWTLVQEVEASDKTFNKTTSDKFGEAIDIRAGRVLIGARLHQESPSQYAGRAYLFEKDAAGQWVETALFPEVDDDHGELGASVALTWSHALAGAPYENGSAVNSGSAFVWELPLGPSYCPAVQNSTGQSATMRALGSVSAQVEALELLAWDMPFFTTGAFLASRSRTTLPGFGGGPGTLCVGNPIARSKMLPVEFGRMSYPVDTQNLWQAGVPTAIQAGDTWYFQAWFRDGATSNFSDAVQIIFR